MNNTLHLLQKHFDTTLESPDGIKKLRELILSLAMQGKLVQQDPKDQPANELLKEIQAEKERLIKEGKIKKQKELPDIKPEEVPYEVPEGWVWTRLGEVANIIAGNSFDSQDFNNDDGVKCIKITNVGVHTFIETKERLPIEFRGKYNKFIVENGDLVIALTRPFIRDGLKICICPSSYHMSLLNQRVAAIKTYFKTNEFIYRYLCSEIVLSGYQKRFGNIGLQPNLKMEDITELLIPLPPLAEQKRIVAKIDELMALCDKLEAQRNARNDKRLAVHRAALNQLLNSSFDLRESAKSADNPFQFIFNNFDPLYSVKENVSELKKAILTLALQGKLVKQDPKDQPASELLKEIQAEKEKMASREGAKARRTKTLDLTRSREVAKEEKPYEVPEGWEWVNLREVTHEWGQKTPDKDFIYIDVGSIDNSKGIIVENPQILAPEDAPSRARKIVKQGTVIYSTVRPYLLNIAIVESTYSEEPIASTAFAIMHPFKGLNGKFLYRYLNSQIFINYVESKQKGVAYPAISDGDLFQGTIPLPPLAEQKRIVAKIDELMALCDKLEKQIEQATAKQTALFDAVLVKV